MEIEPALADFFETYARLSNTHPFDLVAALIAEDAIYWFNDGSFRGLGAIRGAFEHTWSLVQDEDYWIEDVEWICVEAHSAACIYTFHWRGNFEGALHEGLGRGTSVLRKTGDQWQVVHEHLSHFP